MNAIRLPEWIVKTRIEALEFDEIENFLQKKCMNGDLLITMGAGDVVKIGEHLLMH